jgi:FkbM family methyltransferase
MGLCRRSHSRTTIAGMRKKAWTAAVLAAAALALCGGAYYRESAAARFARLVWTRDSCCTLAATWRAIEANDRLWDRIGEITDDITLVESSPDGLDLIESGTHRFWIPRGNRAGVAEMLSEQEADVYGANMGVRRGDVVLDCGANVGVFTRHALDEGAVLVVAIELSPDNIACLRRNFAAEIQAGRVIVYPKGVWDKDDELQLRTMPLTGGNSVALRFPGSSAGPRVPLTTIDKLTAELGLKRVDFIKMDIEGAERHALVGARETVARFHPRMAISMEHQPDDATAIPAVVKKLWPRAKTECGPCTWIHTALVNRVAPEELYVR